MISKLARRIFPREIQHRVVGPKFDREVSIHKASSGRTLSSESAQEAHDLPLRPVAVVTIAIATVPHPDKCTVPAVAGLNESYILVRSNLPPRFRSDANER